MSLILRDEPGESVRLSAYSTTSLSFDAQSSRPTPGSHRDFVYRIQRFEIEIELAQMLWLEALYFQSMATSNSIPVNEQ